MPQSTPSACREAETEIRGPRSEDRGPKSLKSIGTLSSPLARQKLAGLLSLIASGATLVSASTLVASTASAEPAGPDCAEPVCDDKKEMFMGMMGKGAKGANGAKKECPLTRGQMGRSTWEFLHTTAAYYPDKPSEEQQHAARGLIEAMSLLYACAHCREHFRNHVEAHPPDVSSRASFERWLCDAHNEVNEVLGKPKFDCSKIQERWRTGCREAKAK
ncbi:FAD-linked sulfhydryl oxidase ALR [Hondaea fermentalgiana]|uniref:Sulfhydryl oxidase n=1 Tax=Hondaea fermentalgiana TaxID=2315210 RepID=A0A2R5G2N8_9STRA|nr:FAD-linked sulfhydryl oxidase ALR [Hondaea fermentalgiana]|eukprot:GBG25262.1 FAD-linked sulfhydryl oxidase ALR [Hondaea fermentalgiana]